MRSGTSPERARSINTGASRCDWHWALSTVAYAVHAATAILSNGGLERPRWPAIGSVDGIDGVHGGAECIQCIQQCRVSVSQPPGQQVSSSSDSSNNSMFTTAPGQRLSTLALSSSHPSLSRMGRFDAPTGVAMAAMAWPMAHGGVWSPAV
ncbi:hypothetical protein PVAR5_6925 [Paecilomyces variotii No. 5]|uniref:Uncharacterized protein n=1 Tax=Byssochlamys spectabilis (strain No. 5 / NBRC 109023) TaxID=1356009 RepID=V5FK33_BYSSN|nr:hypothetical protein PVAR5_6925 [Paecilomyces variotii No. 5]